MKMIFHKSTVRSEVVLKTLAIKEEVRMSKFGGLGSSLDRISCKSYFSYSISRCSTGSKEEISVVIAVCCTHFLNFLRNWCLLLSQFEILMNVAM